MSASFCKSSGGMSPFSGSSLLASGSTSFMAKARAVSWISRRSSVMYPMAFLPSLPQHSSQFTPPSETFHAEGPHVEGPIGLARSLPFCDFCLGGRVAGEADQDRKSTRLNSSHDQISYAVFCLKKKK